MPWMPSSHCMALGQTPSARAQARPAAPAQHCGMLLQTACTECGASQAACTWREPGEVACGLVGSRHGADLYLDPIAAKGCVPWWAQSRVVPSLHPVAPDFRRRCALLIPLKLQTSACGPLLPNACTKKVRWVTVTSGVTAGLPPGRTICAVTALPSDRAQTRRAPRSRQAPG